MSNWTHRAVLVTPLALQVVANKIARAFDPDIGGGRSFDLLKCGSPASHVVCDTPVTEGMAATLQALLGDHQAVYEMCLADYSERWPDLVPPTLQECSDFIGSLVAVIEPTGRPLEEVLGDVGFSLTPAPVPAP